MGDRIGLRRSDLTFALPPPVRTMSLSVRRAIVCTDVRNVVSGRIRRARGKRGEGERVKGLGQVEGGRGHGKSNIHTA